MQSSLRPGWRVTPLGRLVRPIRMRPLHPLPEQLLSDTQPVATQARKKRARKNGSVIVRARRRKIDPEEWGSSYLSGVMLEGGSGVILPEKPTKAREEAQGLGSVTEHHGGSDDKMRVRSLLVLNLNPLHCLLQNQTPYNPPAPSAILPCLIYRIPSVIDQKRALTSSKRKSAPLHSSTLFNSKAGDEDWGTEESLNDIDAHVEQQQQPSDSIPTTTQLPHDVIEYVPRTVPVMSLIHKKRDAKAAELF